MTSPPKPSMNPLKLGVLSQVTVNDVHCPRVKSSMPFLLDESQAPPKPIFRSTAFCAWATGMHSNRGAKNHNFFISEHFLFLDQISWNRKTHLNLCKVRRVHGKIRFTMYLPNSLGLNRIARFPRPAPGNLSHSRYSS